MVYVKAGWVFDGHDLVENRVVAVAAGRIAGVLDPSAPIPPEATVIDASSSTVMPGLVDAHIHFMAPPLPQVQEVTRRGWGKLAKEGWSLYPQHRLGLLRSGITAIADMGAPLGSYQEVREALRKGEIIGPEVYFPGPLITAPGGHPAGTIYVGQHDLIAEGTIQVDREDLVVEKARQLAAGGVDYLKIVYDRMWYRPGGAPRLDLPVARAAIGEAHRRGLKVFAHVGSEEEARAMVDAGVDGIEHGFASAGDALFARMRERGVVFTPTVGAYVHYAPRAVPSMLRTAKRAFDAGVLVAVGTDFPASYGETCGADLFEEMRLLEGAGIPRISVLRGATSIAAAKIGRETELGAVQEGRRADLIIVAGRVDEGALSADRVAAVMLHGEIVVERGQPRGAYLQGFRERSLLLFPYAFWDPISQFNVGLSVTEFDLLDTGVSASGDVAFSFRNMWATNLELAFPSPIPRTTLKAGFHFDDVNRIYYGRGNATARASGVEFASLVFRETVTATTTLAEHLKVATTVAAHQLRLGSYGGRSLPADVVGRDGGTALLLGISPAIDTRDHVMNPWSGGLLQVGVEVAPAPLGSSGAFERIALDGRAFFPSFWLKHVLAGRVLYRQAFGDVPFSYLPDYGGALLGRGYFPGRFIDRIGLSLQLEYRFPVWRWLGGVAFLDTGMVLPDWRAPPSWDIHPAGGLGPRFTFGSNENAILSLDVGVSREGVMVLFHPGQAF